MNFEEAKQQSIKKWTNIVNHLETGEDTEHVQCGFCEYYTVNAFDPSDHREPDCERCVINEYCNNDGHENPTLLFWRYTDTMQYGTRKDTLQLAREMLAVIENAEEITHD